ncbi:MAG: transporter, family, fosmidomycin resistance protein [Thermoleophilaceae bacterium]|jgi:FSR family fosmidomycin resistance protein-like MFS transporter|nr:transporter, family, fosmidomycin resistance protein [Thermoleophilaceae bacterium]
MSGRPELDRRGLALLGGAHLSIDLCQAAVPALLPFFVSQRGYSYAAAGALVFAATVGSSLIQPIFGHAADRLQLPWLMPAGVLLAGAGIGLAGIVSSYALTFAAIVVSGIGVAAFHPEGARHANYASGTRQAVGMSLFSLGGNAGFALGPALTTACVLAFGLSGTLVLALVPGAVLALLLARRATLAGMRARGAAAAKARSGDAAVNRWGPFTRLTGAISLRSCVHFGLLAFVPGWFVVSLGTSEAGANAALTTMLAAGAAGTLLGGRLADRVGRRTVLLGCLAVTTPLIALFIVAPIGLAFPLIGLIGLVIIGTFAITVVLGQEYLPGRLGMASGVTLGASIGIGGALAPLLGVLADAHGIDAAMWAIALLALPALLLAWTLPRDARAGGLQVPKTRSPASPSPGRM